MNSASAGRRRIYSEMLSWDALVSSDVLDLVRHYSLELVVAVRPCDGDSLARLLERTHARGIFTSVWPMLPDADGRWVSCENVFLFERFCEQLWTDILSRRSERLGILFDLEPPISDVKTFLSGALKPFWNRRGAYGNFALAAESLARTARRFASRGVEVSCAVVPFIVLDTPHRKGFQYLLGTPVSSADYDVLSPMLYTSMIEGYSRGLLGRPDALALLYRFSERAFRLWGARASVSLGVVGTGALGTEPVYRDASELEMDVAVALCSGVRDLSLFDLAGVLSREPGSAWLGAFTKTPKHLDPKALRAWRASLAAWAMERAAIVFAPIVPVKNSP